MLSSCNRLRRPDSKHIVARLSLMFALDAFAGAFVMQTWIAFWYSRVSCTIVRVCLCHILGFCVSDHVDHGAQFISPSLFLSPFPHSLFLKSSTHSFPDLMYRSHRIFHSSHSLSLSHAHTCTLFPGSPSNGASPATLWAISLWAPTWSPACQVLRPLIL